MVREHLAEVQPQRGTQVARLSRLRIHGALVVREAVKSHVIRALAGPAPDAAGPRELIDDGLPRHHQPLARGQLEGSLQAKRYCYRQTGL